MENYKQQLLNKVRKHIEFIREKVLTDLEQVRVVANRSIREIGKMKPENQVVEMERRGFAIRRVEELKHLHKTPYFIKCELIEKDTQEKKTYYFAKHQLSEESIYSWVAPVASIRFESPGNVSYILPGGEKKEMTLTSREQYMIVDGKVIFFAREEENKGRELIYQEHFTQKKIGFMLPEIVAQMEKAQDQVIRAHHQGPLVISGPAGSGKTTLALHRVAYLTQAPDTSAIYPADKIIVFVQDDGTRNYFSQLLPELGIHNVSITTFSTWAIKILGLEGYEYVHRFGEGEEERDLYEYKKIVVLRNLKDIPAYNKNPNTFLAKAYEGIKLYEKQKKDKKIDRFDLTLMLRSYLEKYKKIETVRFFDGVVNGVLKRRSRKTLIQYSLIVVDEFQNYLPEQLSILKSCLTEDGGSTIYVGDMAQQVYLGTIKKWEEIKENILHERMIKLDKVYRNTKSILTFIQSLGYTISVPNEIKEGPAVVERMLESQTEEIDHIKNMVDKYKDGSIGVLSKQESYLDTFREAFKDNKNVHVLTMNESQGVEFDLVCIVGVNNETFSVTNHDDVLPEHINERTLMQRDLLYVALTRAITELHILGSKKLEEVINQ